MKRDILFLELKLNVLFDEVAEHPVVCGHCSKHLERADWADWPVDIT